MSPEPSAALVDHSSCSCGSQGCATHAQRLIASTFSRQQKSRHQQQTLHAHVGCRWRLCPSTRYWVERWEGSKGCASDRGVQSLLKSAEFIRIVAPGSRALLYCGARISRHALHWLRHAWPGRGLIARTQFRNFCFPIDCGWNVGARYAVLSCQVRSAAWKLRCDRTFSAALLQLDAFATRVLIHFARLVDQTQCAGR